VLSNFEPPLKSRVKQVCADAISDVLKRVSRGDAAEIMGCSRPTINNRTDQHDSKNQMTVHELARCIISPAFGPAFGNAILGKLTGHILVAANFEAVCPHETAASASELVTLIIKALMDGELSDEELLLILPHLDKTIPKLQALQVRAIQIEEKRP